MFHVPILEHMCSKTKKCKIASAMYINHKDVGDILGKSSCSMELQVPSKSMTTIHQDVNKVLAKRWRGYAEVYHVQALGTASSDYLSVPVFFELVGSQCIITQLYLSKISALVDPNIVLGCCVFPSRRCTGRCAGHSTEGRGQHYFCQDLGRLLTKEFGQLHRRTLHSRVTSSR